MPSSASTFAGRWSRRLGAFAASLALSLVVAELVVERLMPVGQAVYAPDDTLLFDALPNRRRVQAMPPAAVGPGDAARVFIATNSLGLRGPELEEPRVRPRLLVLGDSFVMAENVPRESTFVAQLEGALAARLVAAAARERGADDTAVRAPRDEPALGVECLNAGRSGYGPDQSLLLAERLLEATQPDAVLLVLCSANDLGDVTRNKLFELDRRGSLRALPTPRLAPRLVHEFQLRADQHDDLALERLWRFSRTRRVFAAWPPPQEPALVETYRLALTQQAQEAFPALGGGGDRVVYSLFEDVLDVVAALEPDGPVAREQSRLMRGVLEGLRELCERRGVAVGVLVTPVAADLCPGFIVRLTPERYPGYVPGTLPRVHREAAQAAGLRVLDVSGAFAEHPDPGSLFVGGDDQHWNAAGQAFAARTAAAELARWPELR